MPDTRLISVEGFPGAGKSTTTQHIGKKLQQRGIACRWYLEDDESNPIDCIDLEIKGLPEKMIPLWSRFVEQALQESSITVIESRLWQNTALFMHMSNWEASDILRFGCQQAQALAPLSPILVYLDQPDTESALRRLLSLRGEKWMQWALDVTTPYPWFQTRGVKDFNSWIQFFSEWQPVVARLYADWPHRKVKIHNPHDDWGKAYQQLDAFLQEALFSNVMGTEHL